MIKSTREVATILKISRQAVATAVRSGRFGEIGVTVHDGGPRGWQFVWPAAELEFRKNTDATRYSAERMAAAQPATVEGPADGQVVEYEGPGGRCEISTAMHAALAEAIARPDDALLTAEMAAALDRILIVRGVIALHGVGPIPEQES